MYSPKSEEFGFNRTHFPMMFRGHNLYLLHNDGHITIDARPRFHLTAYCINCKREETVRGRLPRGNIDNIDRISALAQFIIYAHFSDGCDSAGKRTYYLQP